jgi:hypothetical protein
VQSGPNSPWSLTPNGFSRISLKGGELNIGDAGSIVVEGGHNPLSNGSSVSSGGNVTITSGNGVGGYNGGNVLLLPGSGATAGRVGIGKTNPSHLLDVNGSLNASAYYQNGSPLLGSQWATAGTNILFSGGKVGIGTPNPSGTLHVSTPIGSTMMFELNPGELYLSGQTGARLQLSGPSGYGNWIFYSGSGGRNWLSGVAGGDNFPVSSGKFFIYDGNVAAPRMVIDTSGNVGIGKANPGSMLDVNGTVTATNFVGSGAGLTNLSVPVANLVGTLNTAQMPPLDASQITSGTLASAQIPNLDATKINSGALADARLSANVAMLNGNQTFTGSNNFAGAITLSSPSNSFVGSFGGNGAGISNVSSTVMWQTVPGTNHTVQANAAYVLTNDAATTVTLPAAAKIGDTVVISGQGAGGWTVTSPSPGWLPHEALRNWNAVASSSDGRRLAAAVNGGQIFVSDDAGANWLAHAPSNNWNSLAASADGSKWVASVSGGSIYTSADYGVTWNETTSGTGPWVCVASSADGSRLVAVKSGYASYGIYVSANSGLSWSQVYAQTSSLELHQNWTSVALSADGLTILASAQAIETVDYSFPNPPYYFVSYTTGALFRSANFGASWGTVGPPAAWYSVASSTDGSAGIALNGSTGKLGSSFNNWGPLGPSGGPVSFAASADCQQMIASVGGNVALLTNVFVNQWFWSTSSAPNNVHFDDITASADTSRAVAVVNGGRIYTRSTVVAEGAQGTSVTLQYMGDSGWQPLTDVAAGADSLATGSISTALLADGSVTLPKLAPRVVGTNVPMGGMAISLSSGNFSTSADGVDVTNLVVTIETSGRPVFVGLMADGSTNNASYLGSSRSGAQSTGSSFAFTRDSNIVALHELHETGPTAATIRHAPSAFSHIDLAPAGVHTYRLRVVTSTTTSNVRFVKFVAYEL